MHAAGYNQGDSAPSLDGYAGRIAHLHSVFANHSAVIVIK
jgi:hypothetical protein